MATTARVLDPTPTREEARTLVDLSLALLNAVIVDHFPTGDRRAIRDAGLRLASWHPYFLDRLNAAVVDSSDLDELNYILDVLYEVLRENEERSSDILRATLWITRAQRIYKELSLAAPGLKLIR